MAQYNDPDAQAIANYGASQSQASNQGFSDADA